MMRQEQTLASAIHSVLSAAAEQICGLVERTVTEYEDRDVSSKLQIETQRRILDELLKPRVTLHRAVISETTASDSWNSARTRRLSSALSVLGRDCNGRHGRRKDYHSSSSSSSSSQGELHPEGLASSAEQQLRASHRSPEPHVDIPSLRFGPIQTKKHAKLDTSAEQTSDRSRHVVGNLKSTPPTGSDDRNSVGGHFYTERLRRTQQQPPADNIPSAPLTTSSLGKYWRQPAGPRPKKASSDAAGSRRWRQRPSGVAAANTAAGSNAVAKPATLVALAARGWRGMKLAGGRRRVRVRDHTVLHPSLLSLSNVTIKDIMERSMALAREAGWKRKKWYPPPPHNRSWATRAKAKKDATADASDRRDCQASSDDTAMDRELHQHLQHMFEEDDNEEEFLGFPASDEEEETVQKDLEDGQPSDRRSPESNLTPTSMVSDMSETTSASRDSGVLAKDSNAEPDGIMASWFASSSSSTRGDLCAEGLTGAGKQPPAESPTEVVMMLMTPQPSSALSMDSSVLAKDSNAEPGGWKDSRTSSSAQGELYADATHPPPVEVMAVHPPPALIVDFSILEKYSIKPGESDEDSPQSSSTPGAPLFSEGLTAHTDQLPEESAAADIPAASLAHRASDGRDYGLPGSPRNASPHYECLKLRGRPWKTPAVSVHSVTIPDIVEEHSMEDLAREAAEIKKKVLDRRASGHLEFLTAPLVKRSRYSLDKEGGRMAVDGAGGSSSNMEYFDLGKSDSDEERTQAKVTMEAAAVLAALSTSMDVLQTHGSQDNQSSSNTDFLHLPVCKEVVSTERQQRNPILVEEEPAPPPQSQRDEEEEEELAKRPEEAHCSTLTLPAATSEDYNDNSWTEPLHEEEELAKRPEEAHCSTLTLPAATSEDYNDNSWTEPLSSTSSETQDDGGAPQPTGEEGQPLLRLSCAESDSDEWEETRGATSSSSTGRGKTRAEVEDSGASSHGSEGGGSEREETREAPPAVLSSDKSKMTFSGETTCTVCGKQFRHNYNLVRHERIHTGEKPFSCTICSASFNQLQHLHKHMVKIHKGSNPFGCTVCDKVFGLRRSLDLHMRTHTANCFSCTFCDKSFPRKFALVGHMTTHAAKKGKTL